MIQADRLNAEVVLLSKLFARIPAALSINVLCALGTCVAFWFQAPASTLLLWMSTMLVSLWFRWYCYRRFQIERYRLTDLARSKRQFTIGAGLTGFSWGLAAFIFYDPTSQLASVFVPFILSGMVGGSLVILTGHMPALTSFLLCAAVPFAIRVTLVGDLTHAIMAFLIMVYVVGLIALGRGMSQTMVAGIELMTVNDQLINQLREKSSQLQATFDHVNQGVAVFNHLNRLITWNPRHRELHGYPIHLYRPGTHVRQFLDQDLERLDKMEGGSIDPRALAEPLAPARFEQTSVDGRVLAVERNEMPGGGFVSTSTDITEHKQSEARMLHLAQHDPLTDLPNRLLFQERLQHAMARSARSGSLLAVMVIDLDNFKQINDGEGHRAGDLVLQTAANRLQAGLREIDTVARIGGDEFAIVLPDVPSIRAATRLAEGIRNRVAVPLELDNGYVDLRASFGMALYPSDALEADSLLHSADFAMYRAKNAGGGLRLASGDSKDQPLMKMPTSKAG